MKQEGKNKNIENDLQYLIHTLKLYDEEVFEIEESDHNGIIRVKKEKRIVRSIKIYYKEDDTRVFVRICKLGDRFTSIASGLSENLASALGLELDSTNSNVNYFEYVFLKFRDRRIDLASSINNQQKNSDLIQISGNISYRLSKTPHSLIVGGTGSGKSFFIFGKIVSYLSLSPQAELKIIDPKSADLSLLRFINGLEDNVATEPNQIAKMLREIVEKMEYRYKNYFNDISAFGKVYTDFGLPPIICIFDEYSAFLHSVDKKLAKEVEDYIFTIVMKGRQAGITIEILMQRPSANDLNTNIRSQMGFKAGLGAMDKIGYNMIFDTNDMDYKTVTEKGGGYIQIDGLHTAPVYFETPYIDKNFDFIGEITRLMNLKNKEEF
ncbi:ftsk/spoiiie family protein [Clostridium botulinum E1 str. 'BoNT E Beluga']|nr:ftsk/spoiiie family protein [Clostridium botulinum E1 str. 'BoNT E Beluga']